VNPALAIIIGMLFGKAHSLWVSIFLAVKYKKQKQKRQTKPPKMTLELGTSVCSPSHLGGWNWEDWGSRPAGQKVCKTPPQPIAGCGACACHHRDGGK
jgi:hypothetical protein